MSLAFLNSPNFDLESNHKSPLTLKTRKIFWVILTECARFCPHTVSLPEPARFRAGLHCLPDGRCAIQSGTHRESAEAVWEFCGLSMLHPAHMCNLEHSQAGDYCTPALIC